MNEIQRARDADRQRRANFQRSYYEDLLYMLGAHEAVSTIKDWSQNEDEISQQAMEDLTLVTRSRICSR